MHRAPSSRERGGSERASWSVISTPPAGLPPMIPTTVVIAVVIVLTAAAARAERPPDVDPPHTEELVAPAAPQVLRTVEQSLLDQSRLVVPDLGREEGCQPADVRRRLARPHERRP